MSVRARLPPATLFSALAGRGITSYFGVPDSLLKDFCAYVTDHSTPAQHVVTANEGNAVAMAAGFHLATGGVAAVYLQNSGIGHAVNPLLSLTHRDVYRIPLLLIVGWRGEPGTKDEPQHVAQGRLSEALLHCCEVPHSVIEAGEGTGSRVEKALDAAMRHFQSEGTPYALLVPRNTFEAYQLKSTEDALCLPLSREESLEQILRQLNKDDIVVCTTGMPAREVFELREKSGAGHGQDFLTVGSMGHCSSIAAGIALSRPEREVYCIDGDGAAIMHLGALAVVGGLGACHTIATPPCAGAGWSDRHPPPQRLLRNFKHIVINNGAHDSVGGQPTAGFDASLTDIARASGYAIVREAPVMETGDLVTAMRDLHKADGPAFLEVLVRRGSRPDLGRPTATPTQNKSAFMDFVRHPTA